VLATAGAGTWWLDARIRAQALPSGPVPLASFVGHSAPDFVLPDVQTGQLVRLSDSLGRRPVVLLFGSFSCPRLYGELSKIRQLHEECGDAVDFRFVYSKEAPHINPEFDEFCQCNPDSAARGRVRAGLECYHIDFPCVMANEEIEWTYHPYPARLIVFDRTGTAVFDSEPALTAAGLQLAEATRRLKECLAEDGKERANP
jgi:hypothetical protein